MKIQSPVNIEDRKKLGIRPGDSVRVWQKIQEKGKTRLQAFEGLVLAVKHGTEAGSTFTVRRTTGGVGVEKIYPLYSPMIDKIEILKRSRVRRAKLYYIRDKVAREIKRQMRNARFLNIATQSDIEEKAKAVKEAEEAVKNAEEEAKKAEEIKVAEETPIEEVKEETTEEKVEEVKEEVKEDAVEVPKE